MSETNGRQLATRDHFRSKIVTRYRETEIDGFGWIRIRNLSDEETRELLKPLYAGDLDAKAIFVDRAIAQLVDADNDPIFGDMDRDWLGKMDFAISGRIMREMQDHNEESDNSVEELKKTSETTQISD
jgi:hypothetical protein